MNIKLSGAIPPCATPIYPAKVTNVEALQSSMHQCSSYSGHTLLQLLDHVILQKFWIFNSSMIVTRKLQTCIHLIYTECLFLDFSFGGESGMLGVTTEKSTILSCPASLSWRVKVKRSSVLNFVIQVENFCILFALRLNLRAFLVKISSIKLM